MADSVYELLEPYLSKPQQRDRSAAHEHPSSVLAVTKNYLSRLTTLHLTALTTNEPQTLAQESDRNGLLLRTLASRSHKAVIRSSDNLSILPSALNEITSSAKSLKDAVPLLDEEALRFSTTYSKTTSENGTLDRRKKAMQLSRNVDKISDILELPTLLETVIASASASTSAGGLNFSTALDLFAYTKRLSMLHPDSAIVKSVLAEAEEAMKDMTSNLITSLRSQNIRLAAAIRTIGWLRRVAPELSGPAVSSSTSGMPSTAASTTDEGLFGSLFLTARLANLLNMLEALSPLRDLADQETSRRLSQPFSTTTNSSPQSVKNSSSSSPSSTYPSTAGLQTERYLKRYIEIFREQSFATISMYRNVFPPPTHDASPASDHSPSPLPLLLPLPSALSTFPLHLVNLLTETLKAYLPNITDPAARESLLTQVLYAAGSLGRLGADFGMVIALLDDDDDDEDKEPKQHDENDSNENHGNHHENKTPIQTTTDDGTVENGPVAAQRKEEEPPAPTSSSEQHHHHQENNDTEIETAASATATAQLLVPEWIRVMKKHRIQAGRLEALAAGQDHQAGTGAGAGGLIRRSSSSETAVK